MKIHVAPDLYYDFRSLGLDYFFSLEKEKWIFTDNISEAKLILIKPKQFEKFNSDNTHVIRDDQIFLLWFYETWNSELTPDTLRDFVFNSYIYNRYNKILAVHTNALDQTDNRFIYYDVGFNRQKLYFTDYQYDLCFNKRWVGAAPPIAFSMGPIDKKYDESNKLFLVPTRIYRPMREHDRVKKDLYFFTHNLKCPAYISESFSGMQFLPNGFETLTAKEKDAITRFLRSSSHVPISDDYYNTSYVTLIIENVFKYNNDKIFYLSEKYFDQLIKGNFPLVYGAPHQVKYLKEIYGFKFPDWIDYSYDSIDDDKTRFASYCESIRKISKLSISEIHELYLKDKHILEHNRNVFFQRPYDSLYDRIKDSIDSLGW